MLLVDDVLITDNTRMPTGPLFRYQYANHLGSSCIELDDQAGIVSYEEYHPYGTSAYVAATTGIEVPPKCYRYTGKERDTASGLYYHGVRYCASWLGRWISSDPVGIADSTNLYSYARNNPLMNKDSTGAYCDPTMQSCINPAIPTEREEELQQSLPEEERYLPADSPPDNLLLIADYEERQQILASLGWNIRSSSVTSARNLPGTNMLTEFEEQLESILREQIAQADVFEDPHSGEVKGYYIPQNYGVPEFGGLAVSRSGEPLWLVAPKQGWEVGPDFFTIVPVPIPGKAIGKALGWVFRGVAKAGVRIGLRALTAEAFQAAIARIRQIVGVLAPQIMKGTNKEMLAQAIKILKNLKGTATQRADLFEKLAAQITKHAGGESVWRTTRGLGTGGEHVFLGSAGETLVIDSAGQLFRGSIQNGSVKLIEKGRFLVDFTKLRPL